MASMEQFFRTYVLASVPSKDMQQSEKELRNRLPAGSTVYDVRLPQLKVGTLDSLLTLSDELARLDQTLSGVISKVARTAYEARGKTSLPMIEPRHGEQVPIESYVCEFIWAEDILRPSMKLSEMVEYLSKAVAEADDRLRSELTDFQSIRNEISAMQRKESGNLAARSLYDVVNPEDVITTENFKTLFVVVPTHSTKLFEDSYEKMVMQTVVFSGGPHAPDQQATMSGVVPRSAKVICSEADQTMFRVVAFNRFAEDFKVACRDPRYRFTVREFSFNQSEREDELNRRIELREEEDRIKQEMEQTSTEVFQTVFVLWVHLKMIRMFVESVLRYGLPVDFAYRLVRTDSRQERKVKQILFKLFGHLGGVGFAEQDLDSNSEFLPFVCNVLSL